MSMVAPEYQISVSIAVSKMRISTYAQAPQAVPAAREEAEWKLFKSMSGWLLYLQRGGKAHGSLKGGVGKTLTVAASRS